MRSAAVHSPGPALPRKFRAPEAGKKILVAVSGGLDSMVLLHLLKKFSAAHGWKLTVAHFNHHLRGRASNADEALARKTAATMKLPFVTSGAEVKQFARESKLSIEMAARKLRHEFLARAARERKIKLIALAHQADDQVELFFLRLLRGSGGGLGGMKWRSPSPVDGKISLVRPLLDFTKAELEQLARENKIRYREDATNASLDFLRNRVRHELLPLLRRNYQPGLDKAVLRLMDIAGAESDLAKAMAQGWFGPIQSSGVSRHRRIIHPLPAGEARGEGESPAHVFRAGSRGDNFEKLPVAIQRQILKLQLIAQEIPADFDLIESLRRSTGRWISAGMSVSVSRNAKGVVSVKVHQPTEFDDHQLVVALNQPGAATFGGAELEWQIKARPWMAKELVPPRKPGVEFFDADKIGGKITLRHWRPGDRFRPIGFKSAAKLQDLFTNQKVPRERRHQLILAEIGKEIFWVEGLRISENFKLTPETKRLLIWRWRRENFR